MRGMLDEITPTPVPVKRLSLVQRAGIIGMVLVAFLLAADLGFSAWSADRILPGVVAAGVPVGSLSRKQAEESLRARARAYHVRVTVGGKNYTAGPDKLGIEYDVPATVDQAFKTGRGHYLALLGLLDSYRPDRVLQFAYHLNHASLETYVRSIVEEVGQTPVDAVVVIQNGEPSVKPDQNGQGVDPHRLSRLIEASLSDGEEQSLSIVPTVKAADIQAHETGDAVTTARAMMATPLKLTYQDKVYTPAPKDIGTWLSFSKQSLENGGYNLATAIDQTQLKDYIQNIVNDINVAPVNKKVTIKNGVSEVATEGVDGLAVRQDALIAAVSSALLNRTPLEYAITTDPVPFKTVTDQIVSLEYGRYIEINLSTQHLYVWQDHNLIYEAPVTSGATGYGLGTVTGLFSIYYKTTNTRLRGYQYGWTYDVPVKYWMPFSGGYGLHDAVWRNGNFGGADYYYGGSHGCVNLPDAAAEWIYNWADVGTPVWVHK